MRTRSDVPRIVFLTVFIDLLGFGIVIPLLPLYAERYHPTPMQFGLLMSSYSAMQFVFAPLLGRISDRVGRRPLLLVSLLGTVAGYLIFAFARSLAMLFAARILDGATGGNIATAQAVVADTTSLEERSAGMGRVGMAFGLGFIFGPAIGGFAVRWSEAGPGLAAAALSFAAFVWTLLRLPETRPTGAPARTFAVVSPRALARSFARPLTALVLVLALVNTGAFANFESTFAQFVHGRFGTTPSAVAWLFVEVGVVSAFVQGYLVRRLVRRWGEPALVAAGTLVLALGFLALVFVGSTLALVGTIVLMALGAGLVNPSLSGLLSKRTPAHEQGEALGAFQSMTAMGRILGPIWGENTFLRLGAKGPYLTGVVLEGLAALLARARLPGATE
jgi:DHA1 family tetracycline resistance protein-like MFS transporter